MCSSKSLSSPGPTSCSVRERALGNRYRVAEDFGPSGCAASADWPVPPQLRRLGAQQRKPLNWIQRQMGHRWTPTEDLSNEEMASLENSSAQLALKSCPPDPISAAMQEPKTMAQTGKNPIKHWRRGRDSNPRYRCQYARLAIWCLRPLGHLSACRFFEHLRGLSPDHHACPTALNPPLSGSLDSAPSETGSVAEEVPFAARYPYSPLRATDGADSAAGTGWVGPVAHRPETGHRVGQRRIWTKRGGRSPLSLYDRRHL